MRSAHRGLLTISASLALVLCFSCASLRTESDDGIKGVEAGNAALMSAFKRGDAKAVANCYTREGALLPPNGPMVYGRDAIEKSWGESMKSGISEVMLATDEAEAVRDTVAEVGHYTIKGPNGKSIDKGKYVVLWKKEDGVWKLHRDIWNSNFAPPVN